MKACRNRIYPFTYLLFLISPLHSMVPLMNGSETIVRPSVLPEQYEVFG